MKDWRTYLGAAASSLAVATTQDAYRWYGVILAIGFGLAGMLVAKRERDYEKWLESLHKKEER